MGILITLLTVLLVFASILMVLIILMQRPKQEGLGAAFGGGMTDQMFGAQTTNVLQRGTIYLGVFFFFASAALAVLTSKVQRGDEDLGKGLENAPTPELPAPPTSPSPGALDLEGLVPSPGDATTPVPVPVPAPAPEVESGTTTDPGDEGASGTGAETEASAGTDADAEAGTEVPAGEEPDAGTGSDAPAPSVDGGSGAEADAPSN